MMVASRWRDWALLLRDTVMGRQAPLPRAPEQVIESPVRSASAELPIVSDVMYLVMEYLVEDHHCLHLLARVCRSMRQVANHEISWKLCFRRVWDQADPQRVALLNERISYRELFRIYHSHFVTGAKIFRQQLVNPDRGGPSKQAHSLWEAFQYWTEHGLLTAGTEPVSVFLAKHRTSLQVPLLFLVDFARSYAPQLQAFDAAAAAAASSASPAVAASEASAETKAETGTEAAAAVVPGNAPAARANAVPNGSNPSSAPRKHLMLELYLRSNRQLLDKPLEAAMRMLSSDLRPPLPPSATGALRAVLRVFSDVYVKRCQEKRSAGAPPQDEGQPPAPPAGDANGQASVEYFGPIPLDASAIYTLCMSMVFLNADAHNPKVRLKLSEESFVRLTSSSLHGSLFHPDYLGRLYRSIASKPLFAPRILSSGLTGEQAMDDGSSSSCVIS